MRHVITVDRKVSLQLAQGKVVTLERKQAEIPKPTWEEFDQAVGIRLGRGDNSDMMKAETVLLGKSRVSTRCLLKNLDGFVRPDLDVIHIGSRASQAVMHCKDEASEAVKLDGSPQVTIHLREELDPG